MGRASKSIVCAIICVGLLSLGTPVTALEPGASEGGAVVLSSPASATNPANHAIGYDSLDVEDHSGYSSEYIFGMTKGIMRSTLTPALKPVVLILTIPLDIVFLPFAAIGGFFR